MSDNHGTVCWSELMTRDYEAAKAFYAELCGWTYQDMEGMKGKYTIAQLDGKPVAGIGNSNAMNIPEEIPSHWMTYIEVSDIQAAADKVASGGGTVMNGPFDVPSVGQIAIVRDPSGAVIGFVQSAG